MAYEDFPVPTERLGLKAIPAQKVTLEPRGTRVLLDRG
jgi:hypothetical protein